MYAGLRYANEEHKKLEADKGQLTTAVNVSSFSPLSVQHSWIDLPDCARKMLET